MDGARFGRVLRAGEHAQNGDHVRDENGWTSITDGPVEVTERRLALGYEYRTLNQTVRPGGIDARSSVGRE